MNQEKDFARIIELLEEISLKLSQPCGCTPPPIVTPVSPGCPVCGIKFDGPMGYVCPRADCPSAIVVSA